MHSTRRVIFPSLAQLTLLLHAHLAMCSPPQLVDLLPSYTDANTLHYVAVDRNNSGDLFVAGRNVLYHFSADLELKQKVVTGPLKDSPGCLVPPYPCSRARVPADFDVNLLVMVYHFGNTPSLLLCGNLYRNLCQVRRTDNLRVHHWVHPFNETLGYATAFNQLQVNYPLFEVGHNGQMSLFIAAKDDSNHRSQQSTPFLSSRILANESDGYYFRYSFQNATATSTLRIKGKNSRRPVDGLFVHGEFTYFPLMYYVETWLLGRSFDSTRLGRFRTADPTFESYAELPINCNYSGRILKNLYAAHLSDSASLNGKSLYTSFYDGTSGSALCVFPMSAIVDAFETDSTINCNRDIVGETCDRKVEKPSGLFAVRQHVVLTSKYTVFLKDVGITALAVVRQHDERVAIAGANNGMLIKVSLNTSQIIHKSNMSKMAGKTPFTSPFDFDHEGKHIYVLVKNKVIKYPVASCIVHTTCSDCLTRGKSDPLQCGWCAGRCTHIAECGDPDRFSKYICTPTIYEVSPQKGPTQGGKTIKITGDSLGYYVDDERNSISVAGIPCKVSSWSNSEVNCSLGSTLEALSGPVQLYVFYTNTSTLGYIVAGSSTSQTNFSYHVGPKIYGIRPSKGPISGGTNITLFGENLDFEKDKKRSISVQGRFCALTRFDENTASCVTGNMPNTKFPATTIMYIDGVAYFVDMHPPPTFNLTGLSQSFEYAPDPFIDQIRPGVTTLSGLMNLTAIGRYMDSVQFPKLVVKLEKSQIIGDSEFTEDCWIDPNSAGTTMTCRTPSLKDKMIVRIPTRTQPLITELSFIMDGVQRLKDFSKHREDLSRLLYYPDPEFRVFQEIEKVKPDQKMLKIKGNYLDLVHLSDHMQVRIGKHESCKITSVSTDLLFCDLPSSLLSNSSIIGTNISVEVFTGSTIHQLGYIEFDHQPIEDNNLWFLWFIALIVILAFVIFFGTKLCTRLQKKSSNITNLGVPNDYRQVPTRDTPNSIEEQAPVEIASVEVAPVEVASVEVASVEVAPVEVASVEVAESPNIEIPFVDNHTLSMLKQKNLVISKRDLQICDAIGKGQFGCVSEGYLQRPNEEERTKVSIKTLREHSWTDAATVESFLDEALLMKDFDHPNVLSLLGVGYEETGPFIVLPFMENKDLYSYMIADRELFTVDLVKFTIDVAAGMSYLEDKKFLHRDLAARNCLLDTFLNAKVADFGLSRDIYVDGDYLMQSSTKIPVRWTAPEALNTWVYSTKSDVWSFGVLVWEVMTRGSIPYSKLSNNEILRHIMSGNRLDQPEHCPWPLYRIMLACWDINRHNRPTFYKLHVYINQILQNILNRLQALRAAEAQPVAEELHAAEDRPAAEILPVAEAPYANVAIPPQHAVYHDSREYYLSMQGHILDQDIFLS